MNKFFLDDAAYMQVAGEVPQNMWMAYLCLAGTAEECWRDSVQSRMTQQQTREFAAGVAADACYGGAGRSCRGIAGSRIGSFNGIYCY